MRDEPTRPVVELGNVAARLSAIEPERKGRDTEARVNGNACRENTAELTARRRRLLALGDKRALSRHEARKKETRLRRVEKRLRSAEL